ncbi:MAG: hypothetical protein ACFCU7_19110 [Pleurocapsa sp.]
MLKFINLKQLTVCTFIAVLTAGLVPQLKLAANVSSGQSCNTNNGHGNNADITINLGLGREVIISKFDPSNPGKNSDLDKAINDAAKN